MDKMKKIKILGAKNEAKDALDNLLRVSGDLDLVRRDEELEMALKTFRNGAS